MASVAPTTTLVLAGLAGASPAMAGDCGPASPGATITCTAATFNPVPGGNISYENGVDGLTLILNDPNLTVTPDPATIGGAVRVRNSATSSADVSVQGTRFGTLATTTFNGGHAISVFNLGLGGSAGTIGDGNVSTTGMNSNGMFVGVQNAASQGIATATMSGGTITTSGSFSRGIWAWSSGLGDAAATLKAGEITTSGFNAVGVMADIRNPNSEGTVTASMEGGSVATIGTSSQGVQSWNQGLGDAIAAQSGGDISTQGAQAHGIWAHSDQTGDATVGMTGGALATAGDAAHGIYALSNGGDAGVAVSDGMVAAAGAGSDGVRAQSTSGTYAASLTGGSVTGGTGSAAAVHTIAAAGGTIDIGAAAVADGSASGIAIRDGDLNGDGIDEIGGNAVVTTAGTVTGDAILGLGDDRFALTGGSFTGDVYGDDTVTSANDGGDAFVWSGGTLTGGFHGQNGTDTAIVSAAGYDGSQRLDGGDDLATADGWNDRLTLQGVTASAPGANIVNWEIVTLDAANLTISDGALAVGSDPGTGLYLTNGSNLDGLNTYTQTGNMSIDPTSTFIGTGGGAGVYTFNGTVTNLGTITTVDGAVGDKVVVNGNYAGGGKLLFDTNVAAGKTDTMAVSGTASGTTNVDLNIVQHGIVAGGFLPVVTVDGGTPAAGAFVSTSLPTTGFITQKFVQNPANAHQFGIQQSVNPGAVQLASLSTLAGSVSAMLDAPFIVDRRDRERQVSLWMRNGGGSFDQNLTTSFGAPGFATNLSDRVRTDYWTAQLGLDYGVLEMGGGGLDLHIGLAGGFYGADARGASGLTKVEANFFGGYANLQSRDFSLDATVRHEWRDYTMANPSLFAAGRAKTDGTAWAGSVAGSYTFHLGKKVKLVPSASYAWASSRVDPFVVDSLTTVTPANDRQGLGRFGAKLVWGEANANWAPEGERKFTMSPYVGVYALRNFSRTEAGSASFGASAVAMETTGFKNAVQYSAGISGRDATGKVNVFLQGSLSRGDGLKAAALSGGLRFNF
ncbi:hypothetical protein [Sphingopyxis sp.]|uniref:hypothetical protein n=1 Tax=Sphingopyxis sp. TaxID=1908224 RepID=UPI002D784CDD|nr:hypothetical protein [Sphingopyxis sp.]HET6523538.1 hypothetical protein [Sphingopyxis sp.]